MEAPLLCELHAHSTWSDGHLPLDQVVDLYGRRGFDVLCVTDHVVRGREMVTEERHPAYLAAIREQAARAEGLYGMLVIPGLELTYDDPADSTRSAHAVAVGLERFVAVERGIGTAMEEAREAGAALIAAHPHGAVPDSIPGRTTRRFWRDPELRSLAHRFELINRHRVFAWVAAAGSAGGGQRRLPRPGARRHVEDAPAMRPDAGRRGRLPALGGAGRADPRRARGRARGAPRDGLTQQRGQTPSVRRSCQAVH